MWTKEEILEILRPIQDPELGISIVDLGLIYGIEIEEDGKIHVDMTLTGPGCPLGPELKHQIRETLMQQPFITDVTVELVWFPPWDPYTMCSEEAKMELGIW